MLSRRSRSSHLRVAGLTYHLIGNRLCGYFRGGLGMKSKLAGATVCAALFTVVCQAPAQADVIYPDFGSVVQESVNIGGDGCSAVGGGYLNNANCLFKVYSPPAVAAGSLSGANSSVSASANLGLSTVSATVSANDQGLNYSQSHAVIWDTVTFSGAAPGAVATLTISGNAIISGDARANALAILIPTGYYDVGYFVAGNFATPENGPYTLQDKAGITNGVPYLLLVSVDTYAGLVGEPGPYLAGSASITDPFTLQVPTGVTVTYDYQPSSAVPEPSTWMMMLLGFVGIVFMVYRRSSEPTLMTA